MGKKKPRVQILMATKGEKVGRASSAMGSNENQIVRMAGRWAYLVNASATMSGFNMNPLNMDARLLTVSDSWLEFRFTRVKARAWAVSAGPCVSYAFTPNIMSAGPTTADDLTTLQSFAQGNGLVGSAFPMLRLSGAALIGAAPVKWFRRGTTVDDTIESQGQFWLHSNVNFSTTNLNVLIEYEIEFRVPAAAALTATPLSTDPADLAQQVLELQRVLGLESRLQHRVQRPPPLLEAKEPPETVEEEPVLVKSPVAAGVAKTLKSPAPPATPKPGFMWR